MKNHIVIRFMAVACALCLTAGVMSGIVFARAEEMEQTEATYEPLVILDAASEETQATDVPVEEVTDNRQEVPFYVNGEQYDICPIQDGVPYMSVVGFCRGLGLSIDSTFLNNVLNISSDGFSFTATAGGEYFVCNGRYFYVEGGVQTNNGEVILPVETLAKCLGISAAWDRAQWTVSVDAESVHPLESGETYYAETDVYWLSRVINAEAGDQPLRGQIAVGNVVLNRLQSDEFSGQNDVYEVIFAKNQFDVVANGMIYMEPDEDAVIAAKMALEGCDMVSGATYFATFNFGAGYECVTWIGDHCFMVSA